MSGARDPIVAALVQRRLDLGLSMRDLAELRGRLPAAGHVARFEKGEVSPTLRTLRSWAAALGCDVILVLREDAT